MISFEQIDIEYFYLQFLNDKKRIGDELLTNCPFHDDNHLSFSANLRTGLWKCHAAGCSQSKGGNLLQFYAAIKKISNDQAEREITAKFIKKTAPVPSKRDPFLEQVEANHKRLMTMPDTRKYLHEVCGWTEATLIKFKLGFDGNRYWIPIYEDEVLVNIRQYKPNDAVKMKGIAGQNEMRIWPRENLAADTIYIMEGEKDCILANQLGMSAVTVTAGAGSFKPEWVLDFKNKSVAICYDIDEAGRMGAKTVAEYLAGVVKHLKIIDLPIKEPVNADFTNYIVDGKRTTTDLAILIKNTADYKVDSVKHVAIEDKIYEVELSEASDKAYFYKRIRMNAIVVGKDLAPYLVPKKIKVHCLMGKKVCPYCGVGMKGGDFDLVFDEESPEILQLINCTDMQQERALREKLEVYGNCRQYSYEITEAQNIEEIKLTPEIKYASSIKEYVVRVAYFLGHGIKTNQSYELVGITAPHPQTQYSTHIVYRYKESDLSIDKFVLTEEIINDLAVFKCLFKIN